MRILSQIELVRQNGYAIEYIKEPSREVQLEAVKNRYPITDLGNNMFKVGCRIHSEDEWLAFSEQEIEKMDGKDALEFYPYLVEYLRSL